MQKSTKQLNRKQLDAEFSEMLSKCELLNSTSKSENIQIAAQCVQQYLEEMFSYINSRVHITAWQKNEIFKSLFMKMCCPETITDKRIVNYDFILTAAWKQMVFGIPNTTWVKVVAYAQEKLPKLSKHGNKEFYNHVKRIAKGKVPKGILLI